MDFAIFTESEMRSKPVSNPLSISSRKAVRLQSIITVFSWVMDNPKQPACNYYTKFKSVFFKLFVELS